MTRGDGVVDPVLVIRAIRRHRAHVAVDLVEHGAELSGIVHLLGRQRRGDDRAGLGIDAQVQFSPGFAPLRAVLLDQPLARPAQLQPGAVDQQVQRPRGRPGGRRYRRDGATAQEDHMSELERCGAWATGPLPTDPHYGGDDEEDDDLQDDAEEPEDERYRRYP